MSKKISIISRLKNLFGNSTGTRLSQYRSEVEILVPSGMKEYKEAEHIFAKRVFLGNGISFEEMLTDIEGYEFYKIIDNAGYEVDNPSEYKGEAYILYYNTVHVLAKPDEITIPGGNRVSKYPGRPIEKGYRKK